MTTDSLLGLDRNPFRGADFLGIDGLTSDQLRLILDLAARLKREWRSVKGRRRHRLLAEGKRVLINLEKPSFRTTTSCQIAIQELGGIPVLSNQQLTRGREPLVDLAGCSDRFFEGVVARTFEHDALIRLARYL